MFSWSVSRWRRIGCEIHLLDWDCVSVELVVSWSDLALNSWMFSEMLVCCWGCFRKSTQSSLSMEQVCCSLIVWPDCQLNCTCPRKVFSSEDGVGREAILCTSGKLCFSSVYDCWIFLRALQQTHDACLLESFGLQRCKLRKCNAQQGLRHVYASGAD